MVGKQMWSLLLVSTLMFTSLCLAQEEQEAREKRTITLYEHSHHRGRSTTENPDGQNCLNLHHFNDITSSVNTHGQCYILFTHGECQGHSHRVAPGVGCHFNLADCNFNDVISSVKKC